MVFCFSGTGNSLWVAGQLAAKAQCELVRMDDSAGQSDAHHVLRDGELLAFVFPVHAWSVPPVVKQFISHLQLDNYRQQPVVTLLTCGDDCGWTNREVAKLYARKGWVTGEVAAVQMPNTYVPLPGFNVDPEGLQRSKLEAARRLVPEMVDALVAGRVVNHYIRTNLSWLKTYVVHPLFCKLLISDRRFSTNPEECTACGTCAAACPVGNISMNSQLAGHALPQWQHHCTHCMACYHSCPKYLISYGRQTDGKGQYLFKQAVRTLHDPKE